MFITFIITDSTGVKNKLIFISVQSFSITTGIFPNCTSSKYFVGYPSLKETGQLQLSMYNV